MNKITGQLKNLFYFDRRSLALTRIFLALTVLSDLMIRITDLEAHYTDFGVLPRTALIELAWEEWFISVHLISGNYYVQLVLFAVSALFALLLLFGFRTRLSTVITWFLLISLQNRNPILLQGGDVLLRCLLFWGIFMPWGDRFSVDSIRNEKKRETANGVYSIGAFGFVFQISIMYVCTALLKTGSEWVEDYSAVYYALSLDQFRLMFGHFIYSYPVLMKIFTFLTYWVELLGTVLFFIPVKTGYFRIAGFIIFFMLQLGLMLTLRVGLFPFIAISSLVILIPSAIWERASGLSDFLNTLSAKAYRLFCKLKFTSSVNYVSVRGKTKLSTVLNIVVIFFIGFVLYWNIATATSLYRLHHNTIWLGHLLRVDQKWDMFSPSPFRDDGWYVIPGELRNGEIVDLFREKKDRVWTKPDDAISDYRNYRWRKYMRRLWLKKYSQHRLYYGKYMCRHWNREHNYNRNLMTFDIYFMKETTLPDYKTEEIEKVHLWQHHCF